MLLEFQHCMVLVHPLRAIRRFDALKLLLQEARLLGHLLFGNFL